jgi:hypothetical protein
MGMVNYNSPTRVRVLANGAATKPATFCPRRCSIKYNMKRMALTPTSTSVTVPLATAIIAAILAILLLTFLTSHRTTSPLPAVSVPGMKLISEITTTIATVQFGARCRADGAWNLALTIQKRGRKEVGDDY